MTIRGTGASAFHSHPSCADSYFVRSVFSSTAKTGIKLPYFAGSVDIAVICKLKVCGFQYIKTVRKIIKLAHRLPLHPFQFLFPAVPAPPGCSRQYQMSEANAPSLLQPNRTNRSPRRLRQYQYRSFPYAFPAHGNQRELLFGHCILCQTRPRLLSPCPEHYISYPVPHLLKNSICGKPSYSI